MLALYLICGLVIGLIFTFTWQDAIQVIVSTDEHVAVGSKRIYEVVLALTNIILITMFTFLWIGLIIAVILAQFTRSNKP